MIFIRTKKYILDFTSIFFFFCFQAFFLLPSRAHSPPVFHHTPQFFQTWSFSLLQRVAHFVLTYSGANSATGIVDNLFLFCLDSYCLVQRPLCTFLMFFFSILDQELSFLFLNFILTDLFEILLYPFIQFKILLSF